MHCECPFVHVSLCTFRLQDSLYDGWSNVNDSPRVIRVEGHSVTLERVAVHVLYSIYCLMSEISKNKLEIRN